MKDKSFKREFYPVKFRKGMVIKMKTTEKSKIKTICGPVLRESVRKGGCGNCRSSCQSACKTSCTVANQPCERPETGE